MCACTRCPVPLPFNDTQIVANHFNEHFACGGEKLAENLPLSNDNFNDYLPNACLKSMFFNPITPLEVKSVLANLKTALDSTDNTSTSLTSISLTGWSENNFLFQINFFQVRKVRIWSDNMFKNGFAWLQAKMAVLPPSSGLSDPNFAKFIITS